MRGNGEKKKRENPLAVLPLPGGEDDHRSSTAGRKKEKGRGAAGAGSVDDDRCGAVAPETFEPTTTAVSVPRTATEAKGRRAERGPCGKGNRDETTGGPTPDQKRESYRRANPVQMNERTDEPTPPPPAGHPLPALAPRFAYSCSSSSSASLLQIATTTTVTPPPPQTSPPTEA
jgi:hypothetical protein